MLMFIVYKNKNTETHYDNQAFFLYQWWYNV